MLVKREKINSVGLAILLCVNPLSWIFSIDNIIVFFALLSLAILTINNGAITFINKNIVLILAVVLLFLFSYGFADISLNQINLYFTSFIAFGVTGILYSQAPLDYNFFYKTIFIISLLTIPGILAIDNRDFASLNDATGVWMGISEGALRLILSLILVIPLFKNKILKLVSLLAIILYLNFYVKYGTRATLLALLVFLFLIYFEKKELLKTRAFVLVLITGLLMSFFFIDITIFIHNLLGSIGVSIKAIDKVVLLSQQNAGLTNGRMILWGYAFNDILPHIITGNGVSVFDKKYGIYPHNFIIQILYEGGLVYLTPILFVFFKFYRLLTSKDYSSQEKRFFIFLFSAGIIGLMFSNTYWRNVFFWFFIGMVFNAKPNITKTTKID